MDGAVPGVAMEIQQAHPLLHGLQDSCVSEADGAGLILGSFPCKRVKEKFSSWSWQQLGAAVLGLVPSLAEPGLVSAVLGHPQMKAAGEVSHAQSCVRVALAFPVPIDHPGAPPAATDLLPDCCLQCMAGP